MKKYFLETWWMKYFLSYKKITNAIFVSSYIKTLNYKTTKACVCTLLIEILKSIIINHDVATLLWESVRMKTHTFEMGTWQSTRTPKTSESDYKGQKNTSHWGVIYIIEKLLKCRCLKWAHMIHLDIYNTSYDTQKGRKSNWQFDSQPLKVRNWPDPGAFR
jgi:hypothetical protein